MNTKARITLIITLALLAGVALWATLARAAPGREPLVASGSPTVVAYQGEVQVNDDLYTGGGYFKFAVVNAAGTTTYWSNDGTGAGGTEPSTAVQLAVSEGLFSVLLGDTTLGGMTQALSADVFSHPDRYLRVWFSSDDVTFDQLTPDTRIAAVPYALQAQEAADADTVDGLHAGELGAHYQNVVVVAKSGGDHVSVQAAIDSITDAAADNAYLVWVAPGVYSETVTIEPHVHLQGAGQEATVITSTASSSAWPPAQATLLLASDASLRDLTVTNGGTSDINTALLATTGTTRTLVADVTAQALGGGVDNRAIFLTGSGTSVTLQQVAALAENGSGTNFGLANFSGAAAVLHGGSFTGRGGKNARGIYVRGATLEAANTAALAENGSSSNCGLDNNWGAVATLNGGTFTGRGGLGATGIINFGTLADAKSIIALAETGISYNYGLHGNSSSATADVTQSVLGGADNSVYSSSGTVVVSNSRLVGGAVSGTVTCVAVSRGSTFNANGCP
jgi:hypothetical protein